MQQCFLVGQHMIKRILYMAFMTKRNAGRHLFSVFQVPEAVPLEWRSLQN